MVENRLEKLQKQRAQIDDKLRRLKAQERHRQRRADNRRKIIAGALALEHAEHHGDEDPAFRDTLFRLLNRYVPRPQDRALFGLPERGDPEQNPANDFQAAAKNETA